MNKKNFAVCGLLVCLVSAAIYVAADTSLTAGDHLNLFGDGQTTYGIGLASSGTYPIVKIMGESGVRFQTSQVNSASTVAIVPNGTGAGSYLGVFGDDYIGDASNYGQLYLHHDGSNGHIITSQAGSGTGGDIILNPVGNDVLPGGDNEDDLGATGTEWKDVVIDGSYIDNTPTFSREEVEELTGKKPHQLIREIRHYPGGHLNMSSVPNFLRTCKTYKPERMAYAHTVTTCRDGFNGLECENKTLYNTTQKQDVELCEEFGGGLRVEEYTNLAALAIQDLYDAVEELTVRIAALENT